MSKRAYISRYLLICKKLKAKPYASFDDLCSYIDQQMEYLQLRDDQLTIGLSKRTLQRDMKDIRNLFGIQIMYSSKEKGYFIRQDDTINLNFDRMLEAHDLFNSLQMAQDIRPHIQLDQRKALGTENLYGMLHALKNRHRVSFDHQKYWTDETTHRTVEIYGLKEFKYRWYLLGRDVGDNRVKTFGLDRITQFNITSQQYSIPSGFDIKAWFQHCFGIIRPDGQEPHKVVLAFDKLQGNYIKSLPLHHSQLIESESADEVVVSLTVYLTYDLEVEILSMGETVRVIEPAELKDRIKTKHLLAWNKLDKI